MLEREDNPEKGGGGVDVEMERSPFIYSFITLQFNYIYCMCVGKVQFLQSFELTMQDSHPSLYGTKTLYHFYISDQF